MTGEVGSRFPLMLYKYGSPECTVYDEEELKAAKTHGWHEGQSELPLDTAPKEEEPKEAAQTPKPPPPTPEPPKPPTPPPPAAKGPTAPQAPPKHTAPPPPPPPKKGK